MKSNTYITILLALLLPFLSLSQVKVGDNPTTIDGSALLELESTNKGFLSPRMSEVQMNGINSPADGLMVYCTDCSPKGFYYFDGVSWKRILGPKSEVSTNGTAVVSSYGDAACSGGSGTITGSMTVKNAVSGVTMELYADVTQVGTWSITAIQNGVTFTASDTFTTTGCQLVTLTGTGTAVESGEFTWSTNTAPSGNATATVNPDNSSGGAAEVVSYGAMGCSGGEGSISGTMTEGIEVSGVTMELYADVTEVGSWSLEATENGVTFSGSGTFATTGCQAITLTASGTPTAGGPFTWTTNTTPIGSATATVSTNPASYSIGSGTFSGSTCFDIALSNDNANGCGALSSRVMNQDDFTDPATNTQIYTFTPSGTVSNVRFEFVNTNGIVITAISGNNPANNINTPVNATVNFSNTLNSDALGLTTDNPLTAEVYVIYNSNGNGTGTDRQLKLTAKVKDCGCCGAYIAPGVWKEFMCHNLGADQSADPFTPSWKLNGHYYQWGWGPGCAAYDDVDAPNPCTSAPNTIKAGPLNGGSGGDNIGTIRSYWYGNSAIPKGLWSNDPNIKTANDPCPEGYKVPTEAQWQAVINNNTITQVGNFFDSSTNYSAGANVGDRMYIPAAGYAGKDSGQNVARGYSLRYWSTTHNQNAGDPGSARLLKSWGSASVSIGNETVTRGISIRCIAQ